MATIIPKKVCSLEFMRHAIQHFTPSWFAINMGTGIVGIVIDTAPHQFNGQHDIAIVFYILNIVLFGIFFIITFLRYTLYPHIFFTMLNHPVQSMFVGTFPMALSTIINATVLIAVPAYGNWAVQLAWALWWIDVAVTFVCVYGMLFVMFHLHTFTLDTMTAVWLLPIVPAVVTAASGGLVASVLSPHHAMTTLCVSWVLWGCGISLSLVIIAFYFHRLALCKLPNVDVIVSAFLPLGPTGQGSFGIMEMGTVARGLFDKQTTFTSVQFAGDIIYVSSILTGMLIWGFGLFWLFHGTTSVVTRFVRGEIKFNMGFWGFIFPLGVFTASTISLGKALPSQFFQDLSIALVLALVILYLAVAGLTVYKIVTLEIFLAPCLTWMGSKPAELQPSAVQADKLNHANEAVTPAVLIDTISDGDNEI